MTVPLRCGCAFFLGKLVIIKCCLLLPESVARHCGYPRGIILWDILFGIIRKTAIIEKIAEFLILIFNDALHIIVLEKRQKQENLPNL